MARPLCAKQLLMCSGMAALCVDKAVFVTTERCCVLKSTTVMMMMLMMHQCVVPRRQVMLGICWLVRLHAAACCLASNLFQKTKKRKRQNFAQLKAF